MKRKIIIGSLLAIFMLLMLPSIPAVQFNTVFETNKARFIEEFKNIEIIELRQKIDDLKEKLIIDQIESLLDLFVLLFALIIMMMEVAFAEQYPIAGRVLSWIISPILVYIVWKYKGLI